MSPNVKNGWMHASVVRFCFAVSTSDFCPLRSCLVAARAGGPASQTVVDSGPGEMQRGCACWPPLTKVARRITRRCARSWSQPSARARLPNPPVMPLFCEHARNKCDTHGMGTAAGGTPDKSGRSALTSSSSTGTLSASGNHVSLHKDSPGGLLPGCLPAPIAITEAPLGSDAFHDSNIFSVSFVDFLDV